MDNQARPNSRGRIRISTSKLRRRALRSTLLTGASLPRRPPPPPPPPPAPLPHLPPDEIALEAHSRFEVKVKSLEKIAFQAQNQYEVKVEPNLGPHKSSTFWVLAEEEGTTAQISVKALLHTPPDKIGLQAQNRSEGKVELKWRRDKHNASGAPPRQTLDHWAPHVPPDEIGLEAQNHSEVKDDPKSGQYKYSRGTPPEHTSDHKAPHVPHVEISLGAQNRFEVKDEPELGQYKHDAREAPPRQTSEHKGLYVPPDEIDLEVKNLYDVKFEPPEEIALQVHNQSEGWPYRDTLKQTTPNVLPNETALERQNRSKVKVESKLQQSDQHQINEKTTEWALLITSVLLEGMSAVFDQVGYALMGMVISFLALFRSSLDLICKARKEGVQRSQPFGGLLEYFGLAAAVWQCFYSTMEYLYTRKNQQNPIKMCLLPFIFALFVLIFRLIKCGT